MFLGVFLAALPAMAMAGCNPDGMRALFDAIDENKDKQVDRPEITTFIGRLNVNNDKSLTFPEVQQTTPALYPALTDHMVHLFGLLDSNDNEAIEDDDVDFVVSLIDRNRNGILTREELEKFLKGFCPDKRQNCLPLFQNSNKN
ncbi:hypothetical protein BsWGS_07040 [Bradybaena similaris]